MANGQWSVAWSVMEFCNLGSFERAFLAAGGVIYQKKQAATCQRHTWRRKSISFLRGLVENDKNFCFDFANKFLSEKWDARYSLGGKIIMSLLILSSICLPIRNLHQNIEGLLNPIYNDTWNKVFEKIKNETPENSVINTWWSPGHFIKAMSNRRVTFDGATINFPQS